MNTPIIDPSTLTEEQKNEIYSIYENSIIGLKSQNLINKAIGYGRISLLERLFGEEFFEKRE